MSSIEIAEKLYEEGEYLSSLELVLKILKTEPDNLKALELKADLCTILGKHPEAIRVSKMLLWFYEGGNEVWSEFYALSSIRSAYWSLKDYENAIIYCEKSIKLCESFLEFDGPQKESFVDQLVGNLWTLGELQCKFGKYFNAIDTYKKLLRLLSGSGCLLAIADALFELAWAYYKLNKTNEALSKYLRALRIYEALERPPSFFYYRPICHYYAGSIYFAARDYEKALFHAEKCALLLETINEKISLIKGLEKDPYYRKAKRLKNSLEKNKFLWKKDSLASENFIIRKL